MDITINKKGDSSVAVITGVDVSISSAQDALDLMASVHYQCGCNKIVVMKSAIAESFFDLKTGLAGEILQKFTNYHVKVAIVGDFQNYSSKSLRDFLYESNKGNQIFFLSDEKEAIEKLHNIL